jgi:hypothetical protein
VSDGNQAVFGHVDLTFFCFRQSLLATTMASSAKATAAAPEGAAAPAPAEGPKVTPANVEGVVDYDRLIEEFGVERIDAKLMERFERVTGKPLHPWIRRGIFFSHRNLHEVLDAKERGDPIFLFVN